jgi:hypothetical protein
LPPAEAVPLSLAAATLLLLAVRLVITSWILTRKGGTRLPGFNAGTVVEALEWDFRPYVKATGTIAEPTDDQIAKFLNDLKALFESIKDKFPQDVDTTSMAEVAEAFDDLDASAVVDAHKDMAVIFSALCSGNPSPEMLLLLPMRVRSIFYGWLRQEVMSPEVAPGAGNAPVTTLRSAAAG